ncbi:hypothetical protein [Halorubrum sp. Atlit-26R]|uniref:hypothetical protein n=1 Tax=Halorubrum sp. Atlit-26R TaxID=2282128 RepID=UPI000EF27A8A|nr:hypothetical protein [Halorubrum sp. Atlit-26R]RLM63027.1 hypothetical protein DVK07_17370 [Halorubrum sp. Atlit-26R]
MTETIYAVERRESGVWRVVGERVFAARGAAERFAERYVEDDLSGRATTVDVRVTAYAFKE